MIDPTVSAHYTGDCRKLLKQLPDACVQTCITSPPFWGLRDYGEDGQIGLEDSPEEYVAELVAVFDQVWRVLKDDGTLWVNLGDCYVTNPRGPGGAASSTLTGTSDSARRRERWEANGRGMMSRTKGIDPKNKRKGAGSNDAPNRRRHPLLKHKDLVGIPWRAAFALQGVWRGIRPKHAWYLRQDVIWSKPNPMPESVTDRCTKAHEYLFMFSKRDQYYWNHEAMQERAENAGRTISMGDRSMSKRQADGKGSRRTGNATSDEYVVPTDRNKRSVWTVTPQPYTGAHFATYPPALITPCVLACSRVGDLVLDPFFGSGTTGEVAETHERRWIGFDINPKYAELAKERTAQRALPLSRSRT